MRDLKPIDVPKDVAPTLSRDETEAGSRPVSEPAEPTSALPAESRFQNALSVVMMAGIGLLPIVIAAGFLFEHHAAPSVSQEVVTAALRGPIDETVLDGSSNDRRAKRSSVRVRAGI